MIEIVINNVYSRLQGEIDGPLVFLLAKNLSYKLKDARFILKNMGVNAFSQRENEWDGTVNLYWPDKGHIFYTGMLSVVIGTLKISQRAFRVVDRRERPPANFPELVFEMPKDKEERDYQSASVDIAYNATRGIIQAATGSGKTFCIAKLIGKIQTSPFIFFVTSIDLLEQARDNLAECFDVPIGIVGRGIVDIQKITVMTVQTAIRSLHKNDRAFNLSNYKCDENDVWEEEDPEVLKRAEDIANLIHVCKGLVVDECHHAANKTIQDIMLAAKSAYWRYGASATPWREDGAELMIQALFGKRLVDISASYLIQRGFLVKPYIFCVRMSGLKTGLNSYAKIYKTHIVNNQELNQCVASLITYLESKNVSNLTLVQQYNHGDNILKLKPNIPFLKGENTKKNRTGTITGLRDGTIRSAIATTLADEGLDIRRLGAVIMAGGGKSVTRTYQRIGRPLRPFKGKQMAIVVMFHHDCKFLNKHGSTVKKMIKKEPEFVIIDTTPELLLNDIEKVVNENSGLFGE